MDGSSQEGEVKKQVTEIKTYPVPFALEEIKENYYNLNISRYVDTTEPEEPVDIKAVRESLSTLERERSDIQGKLDGYLKELNL